MVWRSVMGRQYGRRESKIEVDVDRVVFWDMRLHRARVISGRSVGRIALCLATSLLACEGRTPTEQEIAPPTVTLAKVDGDDQTGAPSAALSVAPSVRVVDSSGAPRAGIAVTFAVASGGGTVVGGNVVSDASGIARVGSWTLGAASGINALTATAATGAPVTFTATAARRSTAVVLTLDIPAPNSPYVDDTVRVIAHTTSTYQLASVTVAMAGRTATLAAVLPGVWQGLLILAGTPRDTATFVARATDVQGATTEIVRLLTHDRLPRLSLSAPLDNAVAHPGLMVDASCDDDASGCKLTVQRGTVVLAGPTASPLKATVDLSSLDGTWQTISIQATDSRGQIATMSGTVAVEASTHLRLIGTGVATDAPEKVWDILDTRLLLERIPSGQGPSPSRSYKVIRHLDTGVSDALPIPVTGVVQAGFLTPTGAAIGISTGAPSTSLHIWRNGALTSPTDRSARFLAVAGDFVTYRQADDPSYVGFEPLYRLNVASGAEDQVSDSADKLIPHDVAPNGDVVYVAANGVRRNRSGVNTPISPIDATSYSSSPLTDGTNVVYLRWPAGGGTGELWFFDGSALSMLSTGPMSREDEAVNALWTAFTKSDASLVRQVWTRSPAGTQRAVSNFGASSVIEAVAPDGSVVFRTADWRSNPGSRYLAGPSGSPVRVGREWGTVRWRDGRFVLLLGNAAFAVEP
jgi:hypothetical protein